MKRELADFKQEINQQLTANTQAIQDQNKKNLNKPPLESRSWKHGVQQRNPTDTERTENTD